MIYKDIDISSRQMQYFWELVSEGKIDAEVFQAFLENPNRFFEKRKTYYPLSASQKTAASIMGNKFVSISPIAKALSWMGESLRLTKEEIERYSEIPFSEKTLHQAANNKWRNGDALLWWAPPQRYGFNLLKLHDIFGTNPKAQPCLKFLNNWWLTENFSSEILEEGWHLTLIEVPQKTMKKTYEEQIDIAEDYEKICSPIELTFLALITYILYKQYILYSNLYTRTNAVTCNKHIVTLGGFTPDGLIISHMPTHIRSQDSIVGMLYGRKSEK